MSARRLRVVETPGQLTAAEVVAILTEAGVDVTQLDIHDDNAAWTNMSTGEVRTSVIVTGHKMHRDHAFGVLMARGLSVAPYPERDEWSRR